MAWVLRSPGDTARVSGRAVISALTVLSIAGCGSSATPATSAPKVTTASVVRALVSLCAREKTQILAIKRPATTDPTSAKALPYEKRLLRILDANLAEAVRMTSSRGVSRSLKNAFDTEAHAQKLVDAQIPLLARHDLAGVKLLARQAQRVSAPADQTIRAAGAGACIGSG